MEAAEAAFPNLPTLVTCTTRAPRPGEINNVDYHFLTRDEFDQKIEAGEFLEWAEYSGNRYGTLKSSVEQGLARGDVMLAAIEVQGARLVRDILPPTELCCVYIEAGGWDVLRERITARAPITEEELEKRYGRYLDEATFKVDADYVIENPNGGMDEAKKEFVALISRIMDEVVAGV